MNEKMTELGEILISLRESKELTTEEVAKQIFVDKYILAAIENGERTNKDNTYVRLIIKKYYRQLGGDFSQVSELLEKSYPLSIGNGATIDLTQVIDATKTSEVTKKTQYKVKKKRGKKIRAILLGLIVIGFILILIFLTVLNMKNQINNVEVENNDVVLSTTELTPQNVVVPEVNFTIGDPFVNANGIEVINVLTGLDEDFEFKVVASGDVYVDDSIDGKILEQETLASGDEKTFKIEAGSDVIINIGNINACKIYINDVEVPKENYDDGHQYIMFDQEEDNK